MIYKEFWANSSPLNIASIQRRLQNTNVFVRRMFVMSNDYDNTAMIMEGAGCSRIQKKKKDTQ